MDVLLEKHDGWAEVILNRPERKNAITGPLAVALTEALAEIDSDEAIRVVLLRGAGGAFCSGLDLKEFNADPKPDWLPGFRQLWHGAHCALFNCRKPIVGALERYAINGGAALALACDLLVVGEEAWLQVGEVQQGMSAPYNMAWLNLRHSEAVAMRIAMIGDRIAGAELAKLGVATEVVADETIVERATELVTQLAGYPPGGVTGIKAGLRSRIKDDADTWFGRVTNVNQSAGRTELKPIGR